jgi:hypothetical protein
MNSSIAEDANPKPRPKAWEPLTFGGVARFAAAPFERLLIVQGVFLVMACLASISLLGSLVFPAITEVITRLPIGSSIEQGELRWPANGPSRLFENRVVSVWVNLRGPAMESGSADFQIELRKNQLIMRSILGYLPISYPTGWFIGLNRSELEPLWGAWRPLWLGGLGLGAAMFVYASWIFLASIYTPIVRTLLFYLDKPVDILGAWKLCSAALLPGSLVMSAGCILYANLRISLVAFLLIIASHIVLGWVYVLAAPFRFPSPKIPEDPFATGRSPDEKESSTGENPFKG